MPRKGQKMSDAQKAKLSESRKHLTPEQRENMAAAQRGKKASASTKAKMSAAKMGHPVSAKTREAIGNAHRGKYVSQETREKYRLARLGKTDSDETRRKKSESHLGCNNPFYGKTHTQESIVKMSEHIKTEEHRAHLSEVKKGIVPPNIDILKTSCIGVPKTDEHKQKIVESLALPEVKQKMMDSHMGENNPNWNGGVTPLYKRIRESGKYYEWRDAVFKRDNYTDAITGEKGNGDLNAHHVVPFATLLKEHNITTYEEAMACEALWDVANGITMLEKNHVRYHMSTGIETPE